MQGTEKIKHHNQSRYYSMTTIINKIIPAPSLSLSPVWLADSPWCTRARSGRPLSAQRCKKSDQNNWFCLDVDASRKHANSQLSRKKHRIKQISDHDLRLQHMSSEALSEFSDSLGQLGATHHAKVIVVIARHLLNCQAKEQQKVRKFK